MRFGEEYILLYVLVKYSVNISQVQFVYYICQLQIFFAQICLGEPVFQSEPGTEIFCCRWPLSKEHQLVIKIPGIYPPRVNSLMGNLILGKDMRLQTPKYVLLLLSLFTCFVTIIFLWYLVWCEWVREDIHCLYLSVFIS